MKVKTTKMKVRVRFASTPAKNILKSESETPKDKSESALCFDACRQDFKQRKWALIRCNENDTGESESVDNSDKSESEDDKDENRTTIVPTRVAEGCLLLMFSGSTIRLILSEHKRFDIQVYP